jgi:hypothetical protein|nr:MAG TPA: hypothetical protein [Caudoviricetes sp.]
MNYIELREANDLLDEIENLDALIFDIQHTERILKVFTSHKEVSIKNSYKNKIKQALLEIKGELVEELKELGVTEDYNND